MRSRFIAILAATGFLFTASTPAISDRSPIQTDANLVTALDVSDSVMRHGEWLQFQGMAKAIDNPAFLHAISRGRHGRIGFIAFTWSSDGRFEVLVPWSAIESAADAERVAAAIRATPPIDRSIWARPGNGSDQSSPPRPELRTDVSATIDFAAALAGTAPYASERTVINVCANGKDNVGNWPDAARDRALAAGMVINGLVLGTRRGVAEHFRQHVQGGRGSFVIEVTDPATIATAMLDKFLRDLIAAREPTTLAESAS